MSKRNPRRYEFTADEESPVTDFVLLSLDREEAAWILRCIASDLVRHDETISIPLVGWLEETGPRVKEANDE